MFYLWCLKNTIGFLFSPSKICKIFAKQLKTTPRKIHSSNSPTDMQYPKNKRKSNGEVLSSDIFPLKYALNWKLSIATSKQGSIYHNFCGFPNNRTFSLNMSKIAATKPQTC